MNSFKIKFLNIKYDDNDLKFLSQTISEYNEKEVSLNFSYTYDEQFSMHTNAQKNLSFKMNRYLIRDDRIEENPFIRNMVVGSQLLFIDQFDNHFLFTVTKVDFTFNEFNIVYQYTCQDSFTYQLSRQSDGYTITNDISTNNFLGSQTIDWWVKEIIKPDCNITYDYLDLAAKYVQRGKIIKDTTDKTYNNTILFSGSGTANSLLISLGGNNGLSLQVYERLEEDGTLTRKFWFEPSKHTKISGLKYSPYQSIKNFSLSHDGTSLSTILNIESLEHNEELVSLIPSVTTFFQQYILSPEWKNSKFNDGMFTSLCYHEEYDFVNGDGNYQIDGEIIDDEDKEYAYTNKKCWLDTTEHYLYIPFYVNEQSLWTLNPLYTFLSFETIDGQQSSISFTDSNEQLVYFNSTVRWSLYGENDTEDFEVYEDNEITSSAYEITSDEQKTWRLFIKIPFANEHSDVTNLSSWNLHIRFYRINTSEDLEFATIADQCPWLENKLIDFTYFLNNSILTKKEYKKLQELINDDLRIVNGRLLVHANTYYAALHHKTAVMADLINKIDLLGASFESDVISPYQDNGRIKDLSNFLKNYSFVFDTTGNVEKISLLNWDETYSEYVNDFVDHEQQFLKNIYLFRKYFEDRVSCLGPNDRLIIHDFTIDSNNYYFADQTQVYRQITASDFLNNKPLTPIYFKENDGYSIFKDEDYLVTEENYSNFYTPEDKDGDIIKCNNSLYNSKTKYYTIEFEISGITSELDEWIGDGKPELYTKINSSIDNYWKGTLNEGVLTLRTSYNYLSGNEDSDNYIDTLYYLNKTIDLSSATVKINYKQIKTSSALIENALMRWAEDDNNSIYVKNLFAKESNYYHTSNFDGTSESHSESDLINYYKSSPTPFLFNPTNSGINPPEGCLNANLMYYSSAANEWTEALEFADLCKYYCEYLPLQQIYFKANSSDDYHEVPFATRTNADQFYRRTNTSKENKEKLAWHKLGTFLMPTGWGEMTISNLGIAMLANRWFGGGKYCEFDTAGRCMNEFFAQDRVKTFTDYPRYENTNSGKGGNHIVFGSSPTAYADMKEAVSKTREINYDTFAKFASMTYRNIVEQPLQHVIEGISSTYYKNYYYKTRWYRILGLNDKISEKGTYYLIDNTSRNYDFSLNEDVSIDDLDTQYWLPQTITSEKPGVQSTGNYLRLNETMYYPIQSVCQLVDMSDLGLKDNETITVEEMFQRAFKTTSDSQYHIEISSEGTQIKIEYPDSPELDSEICYYYLVEIEDFDYEWFNTSMSEKSSLKDKLDHIKSISKLYLENTHLQLNVSDFMEDTNFLNGLYELVVQDRNMQPAKEYDENLHYYKNQNGKYQQAFTKSQLISEGNYYVLLGKTKEFSTLTDETEFATQVINITTGETINAIIRNNKLYDEQGTELSDISEDSDYSPIVVNIGKLTNGEFWYKYSNNEEYIDLLQYAALIESNLTMYWQQAFAASKFCRWYLPESWQSTLNQTTNKFYNNIIGENASISDLGQKTSNVVLLEYYVPRVEPINNKTKYRLAYYKNSSDAAKMYGEIAKLKRDNLSYNDVVSMASIVNLTNELYNSALQIIFTNLNLNPSEWVAVKQYNNYTYYRHISGGQTWKDTLNLLSGRSQNCDNFGGWDEMIIKALTKRDFINYKATEYEAAKEEQKKIWNKIYSLYPNVILEKSYSNEDARTSSELLEAAKFAFNDYKNIEKQYNISVINAAQLKGYERQELKIGDAIELEANEFYDDMDDIKISLQQFLFITDISYSLRAADDVSVTVNTIKYGDKVIKQLLGLIR